MPLQKMTVRLAGPGNPLNPIWLEAIGVAVAFEFPADLGLRPSKLNRDFFKVAIQAFRRTISVLPNIKAPVISSYSIRAITGAALRIEIQERSSKLYNGSNTLRDAWLSDGYGRR